MRPQSGDSSPATMRRIVDLPEPDGPRKVKNSPWSIVSEKSSAVTVVPKSLADPQQFDLRLPLMRDATGSAGEECDAHRLQHGVESHAGEIGTLVQFELPARLQFLQQRRDLRGQIGHMHEAAQQARPALARHVEHGVHRGVAEVGAGGAGQTRRNALRPQRLRDCAQRQRGGDAVGTVGVEGSSRARRPVSSGISKSARLSAMRSSRIIGSPGQSPRQSTMSGAWCSISATSSRGAASRLTGSSSADGLHGAESVPSIERASSAAGLMPRPPYGSKPVTNAFTIVQASDARLCPRPRASASHRLSHRA